MDCRSLFYVKNIMKSRNIVSCSDNIIENQNSISTGMMHDIKYNEIFIQIKTAPNMYDIEVQYFEHLLPCRTKRAWIVLGESILHTVFGTATDSQVNGLKRKLNEVCSSTSQTLVAFKKSVILSAKLESSVRSNSDMISTLAANYVKDIKYINSVMQQADERSETYYTLNMLNKITNDIMNA